MFFVLYRDYDIFRSKFPVKCTNSYMYFLVVYICVHIFEILTHTFSKLQGQFLELAYAELFQCFKPL